MKDSIIRLSTQRGSLNPEAVETLSLEFNLPLHHLEYKLRHPFGIYNVSLGNIFAAFENLLLALAYASEQDIQSNKSASKWSEDLLSSLEKLLYSLMEHMDDCENIIKCFFPVGTKLNQESSVRDYQSSVNSYRTHIGKVVNHLKHNQGRLRSFGMIIDNVPHLGYFVEGLSEDGSLGPAPHIHSGSSTAFSYARDIRFHMYHLYYVSAKLSDTISAISIPDKDKIIHQIGDNSTSLEKILYKITQLPMVVFPDEIKKDFPLISIENMQEVKKFIATMKKHPYGISTALPRTLFLTIFKGDGVSRSFRMPYRNKNDVH